MVKGKEILVKSLSGLYIGDKGNGVYVLTIKKYASLFSTMKEVRAAIKYAQKHLEVGKYTYTTL